MENTFRIYFTHIVVSSSGVCLSKTYAITFKTGQSLLMSFYIAIYLNQRTLVTVYSFQNIPINYYIFVAIISVFLIIFVNLSL